MAQPRRRPSRPTSRRFVGRAQGRPRRPPPEPCLPRQIELWLCKTYKGAIYDALAAMIAELELPPVPASSKPTWSPASTSRRHPSGKPSCSCEADGLVELAPYIGARVTWMSLDDWEEMLFIFDALEQPAPWPDRRADQRCARSRRSAASRPASDRYRAERNSEAFARTMWEIHRRLFAPTGYPAPASDDPQRGPDGSVVATSASSSIPSTTPGTRDVGRYWAARRHRPAEIRRVRPRSWHKRSRSPHRHDPRARRRPTDRALPGALTGRRVRGGRG